VPSRPRGGAAYRYRPWGESVAKVNKKVFVFLGVGDGSYLLAMTVKLTDEAAHAHALTAPGAEPAGYGLGKAGWVRVPLAEQGPRPPSCCATGWRRAAAPSPRSA